MNQHAFRAREPRPPRASVLVLADVQRFSEGENPADEALDSAVENCRAAAASARAAGIPIAFVRRVYPWLLTTAPWLSGLHPTCEDMIFERAHHSCYASEAFAQMACATIDFALAGFFAETTAVATAVDAYRSGARLTFLSDASWSKPHDACSAGELHRAATTVISTLGSVCTTGSWVSAMAWERK